MTKSTFHPNYDVFRQKLTTARKGCGLTQVELATKLEKPQSFVSKYERGERRLDVIEFFEVSSALGVDPIKFLKEIYSTRKARGHSE